MVCVENRCESFIKISINGVFFSLFFLSVYSVHKSVETWDHSQKKSTKMGFNLLHVSTVWRLFASFGKSKMRIYCRKNHLIRQHCIGNEFHYVIETKHENKNKIEILQWFVMSGFFLCHILNPRISIMSVGDNFFVLFVFKFHWYSNSFQN